MRTGIALAALTLVACAKKPTIDRSVHLGELSQEVPPVEEVPVHGFHVTVEARARSVTGELLAVDRTAVWVLENDDAGDRPVAIPRGDIRTVGVQALPSGAILTTPWTIAGTLSTFSHGFFLIFSAPVWAIVGFGTGIDEGVSNDLAVERRGLDSLSQYARFPQGLPPGFLRGRPR